MVFAYAFGGALEGLGTGIKDTAIAKRENALKMLEQQNLMDREKRDRDFRSSEAAIDREFTAEQNRLNRESQGDLIPLENGQVGVRQGGKIKPVEFEGFETNSETSSGTKSAPRIMDPKKESESFDQERGTRKDYRSEADVKTYQDVRNAYERVRASAETDSGPGDIGVIFNYMKMLDPGSVVREGEFATAENAGGISNKVRNLYNSLIEGERLTPELRAEFVRASEKLYGETVSNLEQTNETYMGIAERWGIDPNRFIVIPETFKPLEIGTEVTIKDGRGRAGRVKRIE
jgi:hypothetical protein